VPFNIETPLSELNSEFTPNQSFFVRTHFPIPVVDAESWQLTVEGEVDRTLHLSYKVLSGMPRRTVAATLECAGNGRMGFKDVAPAELAWGNGAVSTAVWAGFPLRDLLEKAGISRDANQVVVEGEDAGPEPGSEKTIYFVRSLPLEKALDSDTIIALTMNGKTLTTAHGFPARLIVPCWYAMASVKWVKRVRVLSGEPFKAYFDTKYVYAMEQGVVPVTEMRVKSLVTSPLNGAVAYTGKFVLITGKAWSGAGAIKRVDISVGDKWTEAQFDQPMGRYTWATWRISWTPMEVADVEISARATDMTGNSQLVEPMQNRYQYGYNALHTIGVHVRRK
jgi:DMSO/TMAO reductase YedYZ molybdopterin-dependent catalytic subunit